MKLSASSMKTWMSCPLQAHFKETVSRPQKLNAKTSYGTCMHDALEYYNGTGDIQETLNRFSKTWEKPELLNAKPDTWPRGMTYAGLKKKGMETLEAYHKKNVWDKRDIIASEHKFCVPFGEHHLSGIVDLIEGRPLGKFTELTIIDYKSAGKRPYGDDLQLDIQFTIYWYASLQPEFWMGNGEEKYPSLPDGEALYEEFVDSPRKVIWYHLMDNKELNAGPRDDDDFGRLYQCVEQIARAQEHEVYVPNISGSSCVWCLAGETKVLTNKGYKEISSLSGTSPTIMTTLGKWIEAPVRNFGKQRLYEISLRKSKATKTLYATDNHQWWVRSKNNSRELCSTVELSNKWLIETLGQGVKALTPSLHGIQAGLIYGDGNKLRQGRNGSGICLYGEKNKNLLKFFPGLPVKHYKDNAVVRGLPANFKDEPEIGLDRGYLYGWLAGYFAADGHLTKTGQATISSASKRSLEVVQDVCGILGIKAGDITSHHRLGRGPEVTELFRIDLNIHYLDDKFFLINEHYFRYKDSEKTQKDRQWKVVSVEVTDRYEDVYCATVEDTKSFVIEGNILTHNCDYTDICPVMIPSRVKETPVEIGKGF